jgi:diacylglycerol kinase
MRKTVKSLRYALAGVLHAAVTERNFPLFVVAFAIELFLAFFLRISRFEWTALIITGGVFLSVELLNTAIERLSDALNDEQHKFNVKFDSGIRLTKDVAAAASFMSLLTIIAISLIVFLPHLFPRLVQ